MQNLIPLAEKIAAMLKDRHETVAVAESSTGASSRRAAEYPRRVGVLHRRRGGL